MASGDPLSIGVSGLLAFQRSLSVTGHNISNVNTEGYSRQRAEMGTRPPQFHGSSYLGSGVQVESVRRIYDQFITDQIRTTTSLHSQNQTLYDLASQLDNILADPANGLMPVLQSFFSSVQDLANDPSSVPARQVVLGEAESLSARFNDFYGRMESLRSGVNSQMTTMVDEINSIAASIAEVNDAIRNAPRGSGSESPNDLLDQRDQMVAKLSEYVSLTTVEQDDGSLNVFIGKGQSLVVGATVQQLAVTSNLFNPTRLEIGYVSGSATVEITNQLTGGKLGGLLDFRGQVLDPAANALGRVAVGLAETFNMQHKMGQDLNGDRGGDFFSIGSPQVLARSTNTGLESVSASMVTARDLTSSDYRLTYDGANQYTLTRLSDNTTTTIDTGGASPFVSEEIDGLALTITGTATAVAGDSFLIQPTRSAAGDIGVALQDPRKIATAAPLQAQASLANTGAAQISAGTVNSPSDRLLITYDAGGGTIDVVDETTGAVLADNLAYVIGNNISFNGVTVQLNGAVADGDKFYVDHIVTTADAANAGTGSIGPASLDATGADPDVADPVTITFTSATTFNVTGATTGSPVLGVSYTSAQPISFNGWTISIAGTPAAGDTFTISPNSGGVGDNRNALRLAQLQLDGTLGGGTATYQDAYGEMLAGVGTRTQQANLRSTAQSALLQQSVAARDAVSGVNLDEEAANLLRFQQAYQAAAQLISVSNDLFDNLLVALRR